MEEVSVSKEAAPAPCLDDKEVLLVPRHTKPGIKRLSLTWLILFSFILGSPFLYKSTEIYRSMLPFAAIEALSNRLQLNPVSFPYRLQAIFVDFEGQFIKSSAKSLELLLSRQIHRERGENGNIIISVITNSGGTCANSRHFENSCFVQCGSMDFYVFKDVDDNDDFDDILHKALPCLEVGETVYTALVVYKEWEAKTVIGKHRHFWITGNITEDAAVSVVSRVFSNIFMDSWEVKGEFMPVGSDGKVVLSFSLLNSDPNYWIYNWNFNEIDESLLSPIVQALSPIAKITVESQVLYHTPMSLSSSWVPELASNVFTTDDLPFFVNSNEWHLDTSVAAVGRSKVLHFVVYVPSSKECPLRLQLPDGTVSKTNGFISPMWGGVVVWNPPGCLSCCQNVYPLRQTFSPQEHEEILRIFVAQIRQLFGVSFSDVRAAGVQVFDFLHSEKGFSQWELDSLFRGHTRFNLLSCASTLQSLSKLVKSLPRLIIIDEIGRKVTRSLETAILAENYASHGFCNESADASLHARASAEDAFFHPSIMSLSYSSVEHYFAIYMPYFAPVVLHVLIAAVKELKHYRQERMKYMARSGHANS